MIYTDEDILNMLKALANQTRLQIMTWLSDADAAFAGCSEHGEPGLPGWGGACVGTIQKKASVSQSVISSYLRTLLNAQLLEARRDGKWTYYRVNRNAVSALSQYIDALRP